MLSIYNEVFMRVFVLLAFCLLAACPGAEVATPKPKICQSVGQQCQMPEGPLGVCNVSTCEAGQRQPCLKCISQH
jgi:hypothetical protein